MKSVCRIFIGWMFFVWPLERVESGVQSENDRAGKAQEMTIESGMAEIIRLREPVSNIFLVDHTIADVQLNNQQTIYIYGQKQGQTTLFATTKVGKQVLNMRLNVVNNVNTLREVIRSIAPDSDVTVTSAGGALILKGNVTSPKLANDIQSAASRFVPEGKGIINQMTVQTPVQVNLRVKIAEISRTVTRNLGINWENIRSPGSWVVGLASAGSFVDLSSTSKAIDFVTGSSTASQIKNINLSSDGNPNIFMSYQKGNTNLNAIIDAVASEGLGVILSEPNLTALSGQTASFTAGGEVPITTQGTTTSPATVQYKEYGVKLSFTPTVLSENLIQIQVAPEVSELTTTGSNSSGPGLIKRTANTVVQLNSGQSFAIAGLIQNTGNSSVSSIPGLGDLPGFLGALFRSTQFSRRETELVMIVTPYIVKPSSKPLKTPIDQIREASHLERLLLGKIGRSSQDNEKKNASKSPDPASSGHARLVGPAGFLIE